MHAPRKQIATTRRKTITLPSSHPTHPERGYTFAQRRLAITHFFQSASLLTLQNTHHIAQQFSHICNYPPSQVPIREEIDETRLTNHFKNSYTDVIHRKIKYFATWECSRHQNTPLSRLEAIAITHAKKFTAQGIWECVWIHSPFTVLQDPDVQIPNKATAHQRLLKTVQREIISALGSTGSHTQETYTAAQTNTKDLINLLQTKVIGKMHNTDDADSETLQQFKAEMMLHFIEQLFSISREQLYHFDGFEFNKQA